jgi:hypothetical protein
MSAKFVSLNDLPAPPKEKTSTSAKELTVNDLPPPPVEKPGGVKQWAKAIGLGAVPAFVQSFGQGPDAPKMQLPGSKTELPFAGPSEAMGQFKLAPSEQERFKKANEATDFALKNPGIAASAAWAGIKAEAKTIATDIYSGPGDTEEQAIRFGQAFGRGSGDLLQAVTAVYQTAKLAGKVGNAIFTASDKAIIDKALKEGNLGRVKEILDKKRVDLTKDVELSKKVHSANVKDVKDRLSSHRAATAAREAESKTRLANLDADIAEAKKNLDTKRTAELQAVKAAHEQTMQNAANAETHRITELQNEHDRVVATAAAEEQAARDAAAKLEKTMPGIIFPGRERTAPVGSAERNRLQRVVDVFTRKKTATSVAKDMGWPGADGQHVNGEFQQSLDGEIVNELETRRNVERARISASPIYQNVKKAFQSVFDETGKIWGRDTESGAALLDKVRGMLRPAKDAAQSEVSTYLRNQAARILPLLEQKPPKVAVEGPRGGVKMTQPPPVPVDPTVALDVVRDLKDQAWTMKRNGNPHWHEVLGFADEIRSSLASYVGEEAMPEKAWAALNERNNLFNSSNVMEIATGRKGGDFVPVENQVRKTPMENVSKGVFANSETINDYRRVLNDEGKFQTHLRRWLVNTLQDKDAAGVTEWLAKNGKMLSNIDVPGIENEVKTFAANLQMREGKAVAAQKSLAAVDANVEATAKKLEARLNAARATRAETEKVAEETRKKAVAASEQRLKAGTAAAKEQTAATRKESFGQRGAARAEAERRVSPEKERLTQLTDVRSQQEIAAERVKASDVSRRERLKAEASETVEEAKQAREKNKEAAQIARDLEHVVFSKGPKEGQAAFARFKGKLIETGILDEAAAQEIENALAADVASLESAESTVAARKAVRKNLGWALKFTVAGAASAVGWSEIAGSGKAEH